jgi:hypothetical protein
MFVRLTKFLCLTMLIMGSMSLRSLHAIGHVDHSSHNHVASTDHGDVSHEHEAFACNSVQNHVAFNDADECDHDEHPAHNPATYDHCGICDDLAVAAVDAGLLFEPLVIKRVHHALEVTRAELPCDIKSPKVALANPPPFI